MNASLTNAFVENLPRAYSVVKLYLRVTPIQERMKMETTAEIPLLHGLVVRFSSKTNDKLSEIVGFEEENLTYLITCKVSCFCK